MPANVDPSTGTSSGVTWSDGPPRHPQKRANIRASAELTTVFAVIRLDKDVPVQA
jgi:hypothetical protein